ncbi:hypothetical protein Sjap_021672 [Stephania japonica]|uniref:Hpc2-related domain-containing protein n=1 Tax=Stephania japonica TaxID=461633 RepID=A0AAP0EMF4_9MAGN
MEEMSGAGAAMARVSSTFAQQSLAPMAIDRQRFSVELKPGETTFVSWKKLVKDAARTAAAAGNLPSAQSAMAPPPSGAHPALESRIAPPGQPAEAELNEPPSNRFSAVIEKIERLYMVDCVLGLSLFLGIFIDGKHSSDEEELGDTPDDDQYDTEDSFIDDADLDEYFEVDKSTTKHNGFFVNRGVLEHMQAIGNNLVSLGRDEPVESPNHPLNKGRKKELKRPRREKDGEHVPNKHAKGNEKMKAGPRSVPSIGNKLSSPSQGVAAIRDHNRDDKLPNQMTLPIVNSEKKSVSSKVKLDTSLTPYVQNMEASIVPIEAKISEAQMTIVSLPSSIDVIHQGSQDKAGSETQSKNLLSGTNEPEKPTKVREKEKNSSHSISKCSLQTMKAPSVHLKEGSSGRPKGAMLERAIRELEMIVAESRPPTMEVQDTDTSSQAVKKRLPREVKQKLAKVARLAQSSQGKISEELIQRLMNTLGDRVQLKTLKRNLKEMVELGLSAKQEKHDRFQQIKKEVVEMIRIRAPFLNPKDSAQKDETSATFQGVLSSEEKGAQKRKYSMDDVLENKICDLYDLYVEGMDEYKGPQIRKLYVELAELWPNGCMDNHGIKSAVCRAKERKRVHHNRHKDQEKVKRKKLSSTSRPEDTFRGDVYSLVQSRPVQDRKVSDSFQVSSSSNGLISSPTVTNQLLPTFGRSPSSSANSLPSLDLLKQEKAKVSATAFLEEARKTMDGIGVKKKVKKSNSGSISTDVRLEKPLSHQIMKEKPKQHKQNLNLPPQS